MKSLRDLMRRFLDLIAGKKREKKIMTLLRSMHQPSFRMPAICTASYCCGEQVWRAVYKSRRM